MSLYEVVQHVRQYQTYFQTVSGAGTYELVETQLNGALPSVAIVPKFVTETVTNMTGCYRRVNETYDFIIALDNTADRAGAASSGKAFDDAFDALRSVMDAWTPIYPDGTSNYEMAFALSGDAEPLSITGAKGFFSVKYTAVRIYDETGSWLRNPIYLGNASVVVSNAVLVGNVALFANGAQYGNVTTNLG
jgi:hypothetical protein